MIMTDKQMIMFLGAGAVLLWITKNKAEGVVNGAVESVNPVNRNNIFYSGVNAVGGALTNNSDFSLGAWIYDATHDTGGY